MHTVQEVTDDEEDESEWAANAAALSTSGDTALDNPAVPEDISKGQLRGGCRFYCNLCGVTATSEAHLEAHYSGKRHQRTLANTQVNGTAGANEAARYSCPLCNVTATSEAHLEAHFRGKQHLRKLAAATGNTAALPTFHCTLCGITATSGEHLMSHFRGKQHQRRARIAGHSPPHMPAPYGALEHHRHHHAGPALMPATPPAPGSPCWPHHSNGYVADCMPMSPTAIAYGPPHEMVMAASKLHQMQAMMGPGDGWALQAAYGHHQPPPPPPPGWWPADRAYTMQDHHHHHHHHALHREWMMSHPGMRAVAMTGHAYV